jgi:hypothetical protein
MNQLMGMFFAGLLILLFVGVLIRWRFFQILKQRDRLTWEVLGGPGFLPSQSIQNSFRSVRYILKGGYRASKDEAIIRWGTLCRISTLIYVLYFVFFFIVAILFAKQR